ncbi:MAG: NADH-quinone oxidoreductase subunit G [Alphaproteobacteria bacterium 16-39-46]|nr:MAG: NADH-quinone oxidoreductase subunit G [Alphaproteobacteria bacterium 16-39-46]OZA43525.1 MAG: NADH-quinone oxidoreductase subunit G [Alphaproteobacteria bacterium 17-39-52]HQS83840.1 NADH-quinone oxidoreductase subunit NuoG [Alphaproteobacteria bacterium]HQS93697.1 NADH-quinone oxidoreductase subunit NuoG [Alphaproteobacteria bacterium]
MMTLLVNGRPIEVEEGSTVLDACHKASIEIPVFCYHPKLSIAGNCRMCLVEMEGCSKPIASCAYPASQGLVIHTNTAFVEEARKGTLEFLLINHPLDCPICDQGGECDLQDITYAYGALSGRFQENKRAVSDKELGPFIKTDMTRCILCTRCVRFADEIAGVPELGVIGRGELSEISIGVERAISSELSGNLIDVCPVGALTSKPYAFKSRSWELKKTESIDCLDAVGSNIRIDTLGPEVMRILPRLNDDINEAWISDKTRFFYDGLRYQRLDQPYIRHKGRLVPASWTEAFKKIEKELSLCAPSERGAIVGNLADVESIFALKELMLALKSPHLDCCEDGSRPFTDLRSLYLFNTGIPGIEEADACLLIGTNPRLEATLLNVRLRKRYLQGNFDVGMVGHKADLTYPYTFISETPAGLEALLEGKTPWASIFKKAKKPMVILGSGALKRTDGMALQAYALKIAQKYGAFRDDWIGYNILHTAASRVGALDVGFIPQKEGWTAQKMYQEAEKGNLKFLYLLGADENHEKRVNSTNCFVVYQGHHGDFAAQRADVILPGSAFTEKNATYVNTEGRVQCVSQALFPPGEAKEDWAIIKALSEHLRLKLRYDSLIDLREHLFEQYPFLRDQNRRNIEAQKVIPAIEAFLKGLSPQQLSSEAFVPFISNYYMTDSITRASPMMARATETFTLKRKEK